MQRLDTWNVFEIARDHERIGDFSHKFGKIAATGLRFTSELHNLIFSFPKGGKVRGYCPVTFRVN
ncbi:hypothetical protein [Sedimentitalea todarodis]|uniref:Uncharacterized protein n=1 Tax=Sedimentitalea todarodis TaxID=1631240 RepID=A0ABU3V8M9_9RHOB|nr:hypothetical protein [Sedimentitalea todarodis]MDU9002458.1 hypothetical protein [Sedimentitalea todarodis]